MHGLGNPAKLLLDVAADLNEAYAIQEPLAALLQRHRMLALGHGPLKLRVDTLHTWPWLMPRAHSGTRTYGRSNRSESRKSNRRFRGPSPRKTWGPLLPLWRNCKTGNGGNTRPRRCFARSRRHDRHLPAPKALRNCGGWANNYETPLPPATWMPVAGCGNAGAS